MKVRILDGHKNIGGNKIFIENKEKAHFILDFGKNFSTYGNYFEEFLTPRAGKGILDLWKLNLIPKLKGLYRESLLFEVKDLDTKEEVNPVLLFISHGHVDHFGNMSLIREDVSVLSTKITYDLIKAYQETGQSSIFTDFYRCSDFVDDDKTLKETKKKKGKNSFERNFIVNSEGSLEGFNYKVFEVDHSVPGASSIFVEVDGVKIAYTGDLRFHGKSSYKSKEFFNFLKKNGVDVLLIEGTRITKDNDLNNFKQLTEDDVKESALEVVKKHPDEIVVADFGARNVERFEIFLDIAKETQRKLAITFKDAYLFNLLKNDGITFINDPDVVIIESAREQKRKWVDEIKSNYEKRIVTISEISEHPEEYIVCYSFWDMPNLLSMDIKSGAYIYSTSEAYTEEQLFDIKRLLNWLSTLNLKPYGIELDNGETIFTREYHVSGHANPKDLINYIEDVKPKFVLPLHTEYVEAYAKLIEERVSDTKVIIEDALEL